MITALRDRLRRIEKADLHVHLEGSVTPDTLRVLAARNGVDLRAPVEWRGPDGAPLPAIPPPEEAWLNGPFFGTFPEFIRHYVKISSAIRRSDDVRLILKRYAESAARDGVTHAEMYVTPTTLLLLGLPERELFDGLIAGTVDARGPGVAIRFIFDVVRNAPIPAAWTLEIAERARDAGVPVGALGLGGYELGNPASRFKDVFATAHERGFRVYIHAGETDGPASIRDTLQSIRCDRIGHGVRAAEDAALLDELGRSRLPLEVCPWSNVRLGIYGESEHPIRRLVEAGVAVVLASDDPGIFGTTILDDYLLAAAHGVTEDQLVEIARRSLDLARSEAGGG